jgi:serine protease
VKFTDKDGTKKDIFTVPSSKGVEYVRDGTVVKAGEYPGSGTVTVSARALPKYSLAAGATTQWAHTFSTVSEPAG